MQFKNVSILAKQLVEKLLNEEENTDYGVCKLDLTDKAGKTVAKIEVNVFVDSNDDGSLGQIFVDVPVLYGESATVLLKEPTYSKYADTDDVSKHIPTSLPLAKLISLAKKDEINIDIEKLLAQNPVNKTKVAKPTGVKIAKPKSKPDSRASAHGYFESKK